MAMLMFVTIPAAQADESDAAYSSDGTSSARQSLTDQESEQIDRLANYVRLDTFDYQAAVSDRRVSESAARDFAFGYIVGGGAVFGLPLDASARAVQAHSLAKDLQEVAASCQGRSGWRLFCPTVFLNSCQASALSATLGAGAGATVIAAAIMAWTGAPAGVAGVIAGALQVSSSLVGLCNSWGHGIAIYVNPLGGIPVCWSQ